MRIKIGAFALFIFFASSAHAEWQYTKWGMSPAETVNASGGALKLGYGTPDDVIRGLQTRAIGTYSSGQYRFRALCYYLSDRLVDIHLKLISENGTDLKNSLMGLYGDPFAERHGVLTIYTWHDPAKNNRVDLIQIGDDVSIEYRPLVDSSSSGL